MTRMAGLALLSALWVAPQQPQTPLQRLEASIQRTTRSVNATWGIYLKSLETGEEIALDADRQMETMSTTGDFLPYVGDDVGMLEAPDRTIIISIFTGNHCGSGEALENAIGLVAKDVADYFAYRQ